MMLHPNVVAHAAKLFEDADNVKNSQLIIVDCNPSLLKNNWLRTTEDDIVQYSTPFFTYLDNVYGAAPVTLSQADIIILSFIPEDSLITLSS